MVMKFRMAWLAGIAMSLCAPALAQQIITSPEAESVSLTVYRASGRGQQPINANWPDGYALITETRTVRIPAGESLVRFEGVAEGMFPESAIVTGLPKGVKEKNRDARLLSPSGLVDAYLKRTVTITRTDKATGKAISSDAMITAGPGGGVILQTGAGYEALRCTGLPERMSFGGLPADLSAKPTLSVITQSDREISVKLTLTYMAAGFDWQANYVAQVRDPKAGEVPATGKGKVDIFAWLTLANGGNQSFVNANTMAIAGEPNRENRGAQPRPTGGALTLRCWPAQRTHEVPYRPGFAYYPDAMPLPAPVAMMSMADAEGADIIVTAQKVSRGMMQSASPVAVVVAEQEDLGDLKLYRVPEPVTVNAKGQKQVAMIVKPGASFDRIYTINVDNIYDEDAGSQPLGIVLRSENKPEKGLGLPMPSGQVMVFEDSRYGPLLAGEATLTDRAKGDEVELFIGQSTDVRAIRTHISESGEKQKYKVVVSNARNEAVNVEIEIPYKLIGKPKHIPKIDGVPTWKATVPANDDATLYYELKLETDREQAE
jgi:hypothetical protein